MDGASLEELQAAKKDAIARRDFGAAQALKLKIEVAQTYLADGGVVRSSSNELDDLKAAIASSKVRSPHLTSPHLTSPHLTTTSKVRYMTPGELADREARKPAQSPPGSMY